MSESESDEAGAGRVAAVAVAAAGAKCCVLTLIKHDVHPPPRAYRRPVWLASALLMSSLIVPRADKKPSGVAPPAALLALSLREFFGSALPRLALLSRLSARGTASFGTRGEAADDAPQSI